MFSESSVVVLGWSSLLYSIGLTFSVWLTWLQRSAVHISHRAWPRFSLQNSISFSQVRSFVEREQKRRIKSAKKIITFLKRLKYEVQSNHQYSLCKQSSISLVYYKIHVQIFNDTSNCNPDNTIKGYRTIRIYKIL